MQTSDASRREIVASYSTVIPAQAGIQYAAADRFNHWRLWNTGDPPARVTTTAYDVAISRRITPEACISLALFRLRGRRKDRVLAAPEVPRAICANKRAHEHTGTGGASRPSLRNGFTAYFVLFPENGSFASVARESLPSRT